MSVNGRYGAATIYPFDYAAGLEYCEKSDEKGTL